MEPLTSMVVLTVAPPGVCDQTQQGDPHRRIQSVFLPPRVYQVEQIEVA